MFEICVQIPVIGWRTASHHFKVQSPSFVPYVLPLQLVALRRFLETILTIITAVVHSFEYECNFVLLQATVFTESIVMR
jgi:hypothetical protein